MVSRAQGHTVAGVYVAPWNAENPRPEFPCTGPRVRGFSLPQDSDAREVGCCSRREGGGFAALNGWGVAVRICWVKP